MLKLSIECKGEALDDLILALDEVKRLAAQGFLSGANSNDSGEFTFTVTDENA